MVGVHCYYRNNTLIYVGCSINLPRRRQQHKQAGRFLDCEYKILEETTTEGLYDRERYWINKLDTLNNGENKVIHNNCDMPEVREKISQYMKKNNPMKKGSTNRGSFKKGQNPVITEERNKKISDAKRGEGNPNYGKTGCFNHINSTQKKCENCGKITTPGNYARWHGKNCRLK